MRDELSFAEPKRQEGENATAPALFFCASGCFCRSLEDYSERVVAKSDLFSPVLMIFSNQGLQKHNNQPYTIHVDGVYL